MEYRTLGRCGLKVSEFCLGTMTFGHGADEPEARAMVGLALEAGVNVFDTADTYGDGQSELLLGRALERRRSEVVLATKVFNPTGPGPNDSGLSRAHLVRGLEASLRRLRTDWVDLYYVHHVDEQTPLEETVRALDDLVRQGKVRYPACSNFEAWRLMEGLWLSAANGLAGFACYQPQYSLVVRDVEDELIPACRLKGLGVVCWSPLAGGFLSGKYGSGERTRLGTRSAEGWCFPRPFFSPTADQILGKVMESAASLGRTPAQVALRWVVEQPQITSAILGARSVDQLRDNLGASGWRLPVEVREELGRVSAPPDRYPAAMERTMRQRRDRAVRQPKVS